MKNNNSSIKTVVAVGIGAALFFVLGRFVAIPSRCQHQHQPAVRRSGPAGCHVRPRGRRLIGFDRPHPHRPVLGRQPLVELGHRLRLCGRCGGPVLQEAEPAGSEFSKKQAALFALANIVAHLLAWVLVAPVLDIAIYAEPVKKVFAQGAFAQCPTVSPLWWWAACWCWLTPEPSPRRALWIRSDPRMKPGLSICAVWPVGKAFLMNS